MRTTARRVPVVLGAVAVLAVGVVAGCGAAPSTTAPSTTPPSTAAPSSSSATVAPPEPVPAPTVTESNPPGDIPDNQAFVPFRVSGTSVSVKVPEGWARTGTGKDVTFTDKLNSIRVEVTSAAPAPTVQSVKSTDVPALSASVPKFTLDKVTMATRKAGPVVLTTYQADSAPNEVTGKVVRDAVERYTFFANGTRLDLTLSGPQGADNVDPWRIVSDSVAL